MPRNLKGEAEWANEKYGPQIKARLESPQQYEAFRALLKEQGISFAAWLQEKVREELQKKGGR